jgi:hypothetical protein
VVTFFVSQAVFSRGERNQSTDKTGHAASVRFLSIIPLLPGIRYVTGPEFTGKIIRETIHP